METNSQKITFNVDFTTKFGIGFAAKKCSVGKTAEETFKNGLSKLPKLIDKNWGSIEFEFKGQKITVCKHWLEETNFNWEESHTAEDIEDESNIELL